MQCTSLTGFTELHADACFVLLPLNFFNGHICFKVYTAQSVIFEKSFLCRPCQGYIFDFVCCKQLFLGSQKLSLQAFYLGHIHLYIYTHRLVFAHNGCRIGVGVRYRKMTRIITKLWLTQCAYYHFLKWKSGLQLLQQKPATQMLQPSFGMLFIRAEA